MAGFEVPLSWWFLKWTEARGKCSWLYQCTKRPTYWRATKRLANARTGYCGRYFRVLKSDSENERLFRDITTERIRNGVFRSVQELTDAIDEYIGLHNENPKPFIWTAKARDILAKVMRANARLSSKKNEALH